MADRNLKDLIVHTLKDVYFAEHEILKALPEMAKVAENPRLREAFTKHREQTAQHIERLDQVFKLLGLKAKAVLPVACCRIPTISARTSISTATLRAAANGRSSPGTRTGPSAW